MQETSSAPARSRPEIRVVREGMTIWMGSNLDESILLAGDILTNGVNSITYLGAGLGRRSRSAAAANSSTTEDSLPTPPLYSLTGPAAVNAAKALWPAEPWGHAATAASGHASANSA